MAQSVEHILGKDEVIGSIPIISSTTLKFLLSQGLHVIYICGGVAQLGERTVRIRKVESSILFISTRKPSCRTRRFLCILRNEFGFSAERQIY